MKKVSLDKTMHIASTSKCGKGNNKRYAFQDFSNLIELRDSMRQSEKRKPKKKTHKRRTKPYGTDINANCTHVLIPCEPRTYINEGGKQITLHEQWIVIDRVIPVDIYVPGCPPRPEQLMDGIIKLHNKVKNEKLKKSE